MKGAGPTCPQEEVEEAQCHLNYEDETCPSFLIAGKGTIRENINWVIVHVCVYTSSHIACQDCRENISKQIVSLTHS